MNGIYCDSISRHIQAENEYLAGVIEVKDKTITSLEEKAAVTEQINMNQHRIIETLTQDVKQKDKSINRERRKTRMLGAALAVVIIIVIL